MPGPTDAAQEGPGSDEMQSPSVAPGSSRRRSRTRPLGVMAAVIGAAALVGLLGFGILAQNPNTSIDDGLAQGRPARAPSFVLQILQRGELGSPLRVRLAPVFAGANLNMDDLRGVPVVLNIWASWCDPCKQEAPLLERAWSTLGRRNGVLFLGLDQQDATPDAHAFTRSYGIDYPNVRDPGDGVPRKYGATGIPETYFISAHGYVVSHVPGAVTARQLRDGIAAARSGQLVGVRPGGARRRSR